MAISAKTGKVLNDDGTPKEVEVSREIPEALDALVDEFGEDVVASAANQHLRVQAQAAIRRLLEAGKTDDEIEATMKTWQPGMKIASAPKDPKAAFRAAWSQMSAEERAELLRDLKG